MQLVAMGSQDVFLTGNPQITFLKWFIEDIQIFLKNVLNNN